MLPASVQNVLGEAIRPTTDAAELRIIVMSAEAKIEFTPAIDSAIIMGYAGDREAMFVAVGEEHGLDRDTITKRAKVLGINQAMLEQMSLSEVRFGPRSCLVCDAIFLSRGPAHRRCRKCTR